MHEYSDTEAQQQIRFAVSPPVEVVIDKCCAASLRTKVMGNSMDHRRTIQRLDRMWQRTCCSPAKRKMLRLGMFLLTRLCCTTGSLTGVSGKDGYQYQGLQAARRSTEQRCERCPFVANSAYIGSAAAARFELVWIEQVAACCQAS